MVLIIHWYFLEIDYFKYDYKLLVLWFCDRAKNKNHLHFIMKNFMKICTERGKFVGRENFLRNTQGAAWILSNLQKDVEAKENTNLEGLQFGQESSDVYPKV